jgi:pyruvate dehydrogenase E2 component (dihydrolipoamide acetyltransferase)
MAAAVTVPRLGWSMEEGVLLEWLKQDGELVRPGDPLFVLESEKAAETIEAIDGGILRLPSGGPQPGDRVQVGQVLAHLVAEGEIAPMVTVKQETTGTAAAPKKGCAPAGPAARRTARAMNVDLAAVSGSGPGGRITEADVARHRQTPRKQAVTPRARRVARELGVDWQSVHGSGRHGRIRERDIRARANISQTPHPQPLSPKGRGEQAGQLIPHTQTRRSIAARMVAGVTQAAPVTLTTKADATNLVNVRAQFRASSTDGKLVPSYTDLLVKLTATALRQHPLLQAQWHDDGLFVPERIDIAIAVDADAGLLVPVVRGADRLTLREVTVRSQELISAARAGKLTAEQMRDATFTISNLGSLGIDAFTPIIHLPQCAVLGIGRIVREPAVVGDAIVPRERITLSLTFDHRVVDGAPAARFLDTLRRAIETPLPSLLP